MEGVLETDSRVTSWGSRPQLARNLRGPESVAVRRSVEVLMTGSRVTVGGLLIRPARYVQEHEQAAVRRSLKNWTTSNSGKIHFAI